MQPFTKEFVIFTLILQLVSTACGREVIHLKDYIRMGKRKPKSPGSKPIALSFRTENRHDLSVKLTSKTLL